MTTPTQQSGALAAIWENVSTIFWALLLAFGLRFWIAQPFRIPSSSMEPTLQVGDYVVVPKWSFGYTRFSFAPLERLLPDGRLFPNDPERGDIVVFRSEAQPEIDLIKRLVGMPGDTIRLDDGAMSIRRAGDAEFTAVIRTPRPDVEMPDDVFGQATAYEETLPWGGPTYVTFDWSPGAPLDDGEWTVPEGHYFMMGDNRDNSGDSRVPCPTRPALPGEEGGEVCADLPPVGFIAPDRLVGPARFVLVSFDRSTTIAPWTWVTGFRGDRFLKPLE